MCDSERDRKHIYVLLKPKICRGQLAVRYWTAACLRQLPKNSYRKEDMQNEAGNDQEKLVRIEMTVPEASLVAHLLWCHEIDNPEDRAIAMTARDKVADALQEAGSGWVP